MVVCARVLATVTIAGEPSFDQVILRFMLTWKADLTRRTQFTPARIRHQFSLEDQITLWKEYTDKYAD